MVSGPVEKTGGADTRSRWRYWLHRLLPLIVGGGLLTLILSRTDLARLKIVLLQVQWPWYALAQLLVPVNLVIIAARWRFDLSLLGLRYPFGELFLVDNAGSLAGAATPGRMGDLARLMYFREDKDVIVRVGLSILVERLFDLIGLVWLATGFIIIFPLPWEVRKLLLNLILAAHLVGLVLVGSAWFFRSTDWLSGKIIRLIPEALRARFAGHAQDLWAAMTCYATWRLSWPVILTFLNWGVCILSAELSTWALGLPLKLWQTGACFCLSTLFTLIPVSVAGIGTRELAMVYLFSCLGLPPEQAVAFSFLLFGFLLTHSLVGFLALLVKPPQAKEGLPADAAEEDR